jgi:hypothetical protein
MGESEDMLFLSRHQQRSDKDTYQADQPKESDSEHPDYPGITRAGVEKGQEVARTDLVDMVEQAEADAIIFLGGSSEEDRTKSTSKVYGDTLAEHYKENEDVVVVTQDEINKLFSKESEGSGKISEKIKELVNSNAGKKLVVDYPLFLRNLSLRPMFRDPQTGERNELSHALEKISGQDADKSFKVLLETKGDLGEYKTEKTPQQVATEHMREIERLQKFAKKFTGDRQFILGLTGHGWNLDTLAIYLANEGKVTTEGFDKLEGKTIKQGEIIKLETKDDKVTFTHRDKEYEVPEELIGGLE